MLMITLYRRLPPKHHHVFRQAQGLLQFLSSAILRVRNSVALQLNNSVEKMRIKAFTLLRFRVNLVCVKTMIEIYKYLYQ